jgi:hypothetical protein
MRIATMIVAALLFSWPAKADPVHGVVAIDKAEIPDTIDRALIGDTVFQMITFSPAAQAPDVVDTPSKPVKLKGMDKKSPAYRDAVQLRSCQVQKIRRCPVFRQVSEGTAFVIGSRNRIGTSLHGIASWMHHVALNNRDLDMTRICPPFRLKPYKRKTVYDGIEGSGRCKLVYYDPNAALGQADNKSDNSTTSEFKSDYVEIKLDKDVSRSFLKKAEIGGSNKLYTFGYPDLRRAPAEDYPLPDPDTIKPGTLVATVGQWYYSGPSPLFYSDSASYGGMSGGPSLNAEGRVMGAMIGGRTGQTIHISVDRNTLDAVWPGAKDLDP